MAEERVERRLAAVLAADVAGYSRLMGADEEGTHAALTALRRGLSDPKIAEHRGRIVKTTSDGLLVEFASIVDAVRCAVELQREMALRNDGVPKERRIEFRIGINLGDIDEAHEWLKRLLEFQPGLTIAGCKAIWAAMSFPPKIVDLYVEGFPKAGLPEE